MSKLTLLATILSVMLLSGCTVQSYNQKKSNPSSNTNMQSNVVDIPPSSNTQNYTITQNKILRFRVIGQGVSPVNTISPAQAIALAKRAAIADAYRQLGERISGVRVEGRDKIQNMVVSSSSIRTYINTLIKNAKIVDSKSKDGLYEVEMEVVVNGKDIYTLCN
jgi:hypothetical protein